VDVVCAEKFSKFRGVSILGEVCIEFGPFSYSFRFFNSKIVHFGDVSTRKPRKYAHV